MAARIERAARQIADAGGLVAGLPFDLLIHGDVGFWLERVLRLPPPDRDRLAVVQFDRRTHNATPDARRALFPDDLYEQEQAVRDAIASAGDVPLDTRQKVDIVVLTLGTVRRELMLALLEVGRNRHYDLSIGVASANPTSNNRCQICKEFLDNERRADWLVMIDEDTVPRTNLLRWCDSGEWDIVSLVTPCWKPTTSPASPIVWNVQLDAGVEKFPPITHDPDVEVYAGTLPTDRDIIPAASAGTGVILIHRRVLEHPAMRAPFVDEFDEFGIRMTGHDLAFCTRARELGFRVGSALDAPCSHYKDVDLLDVARVLAKERRT